RIILLEAETEWIDNRMAGLARGGPGEFRHFIAHCQIRGEVGVLKYLSHGRRFEYATDNVPRQKHPTMDWGRRFLIRELGKEIRMCDDTGALLRVEFHLHEIVRGFTLRKLDAIEAGEAFVDEQTVVQEQLAIVRRTAP